ncbi:MAG: iron-containing alcohol dehydrogenase [Rickettsiales bacterium]|nr:iron-containing alcohol dehydrogenase [Rickettsiales bacterium]
MPAIQYVTRLPDTITELVRSYFDGQPLLLVCDENTHKALGTDLLKALQAAEYPVQLEVLSGKSIKANVRRSEHVQSLLNADQQLIAVGSGTINDIVKHAAFNAGREYVVCPTAPSMNGYTSSTASLINGKHKQSFQAVQPKAVWIDEETLRTSPFRMVRAGLGDMLCRSTVQADWLLSHHLLGTSYDDSVFQALLPLEHEVMRHADLLSKRDPHMLKLLMDMLIIAGDGMAAQQSSASASQGEHMIAHTMELLFPAYTNSWLHGEQIAVTTLHMARAQEKLLLKQPLMKPNYQPKKRFQTLFGVKIGNEMYETYQKKVITQEQADAINAKLDKSWPDIQAQIRAQMVSATQLEIALHKASAPTNSVALNWDKECYESVILNAHLSRDRFTFLDVAAMDKSMRMIVQ